MPKIRPALGIIGLAIVCAGTSTRSDQLTYEGFGYFIFRQTLTKPNYLFAKFRRSFL